MTEGTGSRLVVDRVDVLPGRPFLLVSGRLSGRPVGIGDAVTIRYGDRDPVATVIRTVELHTRPGVTTIAIDDSLRDEVGPGAELSTTA